MRSLCLVVALSASVSAAETTQLRYERAPGAEGCPDEDSIRRGVAARLGRDPFQSDSARIVTARIFTDDKGLVARIEVAGADGQLAGEREVRVATGQCGELAESVEFAIAIAIDPIAATEQPSPPEEPRSQPSTQPSQTQKILAEPPAPAQPRARWHGAVGGSVLSSAGAGPDLAVGFELLLRIRRGSFSVAVEGRADLPTYATAQGGMVSAETFSGLLVPCVHRASMAGCLLLVSGAVRGDAQDLPSAHVAAIPYFAAGARLAWERSLGFASLSLHVDAVAPFTRTALLVGERTVWTAPPVSASVGASLIRTIW